MPEVLLHSVEEACRVLGIGRSTLYSLVKTNQIRPVKLRGRRMVPSAELVRYVDELAAQSAGLSTDVRRRPQVLI